MGTYYSETLARRVTVPEDDTVEEHNACPKCGERRMDYLQWTDMDEVVCGTCGHTYDPACLTETLSA